MHNKKFKSLTATLRLTGDFSLLMLLRTGTLHAVKDPFKYKVSTLLQNLFFSPSFNMTTKVTFFTIQLFH